MVENISVWMTAGFLAETKGMTVLCVAAVVTARGTLCRKALNVSLGALSYIPPSHTGIASTRSES